MNTISISTQKGGVAKSTSTIEIASILKSRGYKVLVIDFDQQCSLSKNIAADLSAPSIYEVLHGKISIKDAIQKNELFDIIPGSESLSKADREFVEADDIFLLSDLKDIVADDYDFLFIDNGPSRNVLLTMTLIACDYLIIPTECDESSIDGLVTIQKDLKRFVEGKRSFSHAKVMGYILTKYERTNAHAIALENITEIAKENDFKPFVSVVSKAISFSNVKTFHTALSLMDKRHKATKEYNEIVDNILKKVGK